MLIITWILAITMLVGIAFIFIIDKLKDIENPKNEGKEDFHFIMDMWNNVMPVQMKVMLVIYMGGIIISTIYHKLINIGRK